MNQATKLDPSSVRKVVAFRIGAQEFCVDIMSVREIRCWTPATALPHTPNFVRGVINLRGFVLPIIDLASRFGFPPTEPSAQHVIIVTQIANRTVGLLVDAVSDILTVTDDLVQPTPDIVSDMVETFVRGVFLVDGRMISLVALDDIVPSSERDAA
jgi:purine-binding chemotaxis protein CheW